MAKNAFFTIIAVALLVLGFLVIWKLVLPFLGLIIGDFFGGSFGSLFSYLGNLLAGLF